MNSVLEKPEETTTRSRQNKDFVMLYRKFIQDVAELGLADPKALQVLLFIVRFMDGKNALAVTMETIAQCLKMSRQTVSTKIKYLEKNGWICIAKLGHQNIYIVNPDVVWTSYDDQKGTCAFQSSILLGSDDSWEALRRKDKNSSYRFIDCDALLKIKEAMEEEF